MQSGVSDDQLLRAMAGKLSNNAEFMAFALAVYQQQEGLDDSALAKKLQTLPDMLVRLALCKRPSAHSTEFAEQVRELSDYTLIDERLLAEVIRMADDALVRGRGDGERSRQSARRRAALRRFPLSLARVVALACVALIAVTAGLLWRNSGKNVSRDDEIRGGNPPQAGAAEVPGRSVSPEVDNSGLTQKSGIAKDDKSTADGMLAAGSRLRPRPARAQVTIELDDRSSVRGLDAKTAEQTIALDAVATRFVLKLPQGSNRGAYLISLRDSFAQQVRKAKAASPDGKELRFSMDLSGIARKDHFLCIEHQGELPDCHLVSIRDKAE